jgi:hypothetical protein
VVFVRVVKLDLDAPQPRQASLRPTPVAPAQPLVLVIWRDAFFDFDQKSSDDFRSEYLVHTVGFLVAEGQAFISLAQEVLPDDEGFRAVTHIPRSVVERTILLQTPGDDAPPPAE